MRQSLLAPLKDLRVTVMGLGRFGGGIAVARWLCEQGARVLVTDKDPADRLSESMEKLQGLPIEFRLGEHREDDFRFADLVVTSPAVQLNNSYLDVARDAGIPITTEICLFVARCTARRVIGVTGTKGKSTTTAMLGEILARPFKTWVGGNIGGSLLAQLSQIQPDDLVVLELSSYMLEHLKPLAWSPHVAVVTLIEQDHLDWHGGFENYVDAKKNIVRCQTASDFAVLNGENVRAMAFSQDTVAQVVRYDVSSAPPFELIVPGRHNQLNAQGAFAAARCMGVSWDEAQIALRDFKGLPHRLQLVHEASGVRWYNDSIATIPQAAVAANEAFDAGRVIQIVGGSDKHLDLSGMVGPLASRCRAVLTIGQTGPALAVALRDAGAADVRECVTLDSAVDTARQIATTGDVVLLSTGCASYDQFTHFEARGEAFARLARAST